MWFVFNISFINPMKKLFYLSYLILTFFLLAQTVHSQELQSKATKSQVAAHMYKKMFQTLTAPVINEKLENDFYQRRGYVVGDLIILKASLSAQSEVMELCIYKDSIKIKEELVRPSYIDDINTIIYKFISLVINEYGSLDVLIKKIQEEDSEHALLSPIVELLSDKLFNNISWVVPYKLAPGTNFEYRGYTIGKTTLAVSTKEDDKLDIVIYADKVIMFGLVHTIGDLEYYISKFLLIVLNECKDIEDLKKKILDQENKVVERTINVESEKFTVSIYDNAYLDNDVVDCSLNGELLKQDINISTEPYKVNVDLTQNPNTEIIILPKNTGEDWPCTIGIKANRPEEDLTIFAYREQPIKITFKYSEPTAEVAPETDIDLTNVSISEEKTIYAGAEETTLYILDYGQIDNDVIDFYLNGNLVEQDIVLSRKPYKISIDPKEYPKAEIMFLAKSTGTEGPCTINVKIKGTDKTFRMGAKKDQFMKIKLQ